MNLNKGIYRFVNSRKAGTKWSTQPLDGKEFEAFLYRSVIVFEGYGFFFKFMLCPFDFFVLKLIIYCRLLLDNAIMNAWIGCISMYFILLHKPFYRHEYKWWINKCKKTQSCVYSAFSSYQKDFPWLSFNTTNFHSSAKHWVLFIFWHGAPSVMSTQLWERYHQTIKFISDISNFKDFEKDVPVHVCNDQL